MKNTNKIIAILMISLIIISVQTPTASAQGVFGALNKVFDAFGKLFGGIAGWIEDVATGRIAPGEAIGKVIGGVVTGVLTGVYNGLESSLETIIRGTVFDVAYRKAKHNVKFRLDEKYKLESLKEELDDLKTDFNALKKEVADAGCEGTGEIDFGEGVVTEPPPGDQDTGGLGPQPTTTERREYNEALDKYKQAKDDIIGGTISKGKFRRIQKEFRDIQKKLKEKYPHAGF